MIGKKFGKLTITKQAPTHRTPNGSKKIMVHTKCECGNTTISDWNHIKNGRIKSCGCSRKSPRKIYHYKGNPITPQEFATKNGISIDRARKLLIAKKEPYNRNLYTEEKLTSSELARRHNVSRQCMHAKIKSGWNPILPPKK